jgi:DNA-binding PadR family transcriptional regulator
MRYTYKWGYTYELNKMGDLQKKILGHMLECTSELENTNHISKALGLAQPTIFKSIRLLEKERYVQTRQENPHGIRTLKLTDKGVTAALLAGEEKNKIYSYLQRRAPSSNILLLMNILKDRNDLDSEWMKSFIGYMLYQKQSTNKSDKKITKELIATLIAGPKNHYVDASKLRRILGPDEIFWLVEELQHKIKYINSIINQLVSEEPNQSKSKRGIILFESPAKIEQLLSEQPSKNKSIFELKLRQPKFANTKVLKSILEKLYSTSAEQQIDSTKDEEFYAYFSELSEALNAYMPSDQLKLQVNQENRELSITPIIKASKE